MSKTTQNTLTYQQRIDLVRVRIDRGSTDASYLAALQRLLDAGTIWELSRSLQDLAICYIDAGLVSDTRYNH